MRREFSGELRGPIIKDRLHYFLGGILLARDVAVPDLTTIDPHDVRAVQQNFRDVRGIAKITFLPTARDRFDALGSVTRGKTDYADITGLDDPSASTKVVAPTTVYEFGWTHTSVQSSFNARLAGFNASESHLGGLGVNVPGIQVFRLGRQPLFQNSTFNERLKPTSVGGNVTYKRETSFSGASNLLVVGGDYRRGSFRDVRTRNGGLTWFPYVDQVKGTIDVTNARSWPDAASQWGGEIHLNSDVEDAAVFVQDYLTPIPNVTISQGARLGRWKGYLTPIDTAGGRFLAARAQACLQASDKTFLEDALFHGVLGQAINLEQRGARKYPGHSNLDLRLERVFAKSFSFTADLFNALANDAIIERNLTVNDQVTNDPTSVFGAARGRVNPLALQIGLRLEF